MNCNLLLIVSYFWCVKTVKHLLQIGGQIDFSSRSDHQNFSLSKCKADAKLCLPWSACILCPLLFKAAAPSSCKCISSRDCAAHSCRTAVDNMFHMQESTGEPDPVESCHVLLWIKGSCNRPHRLVSTERSFSGIIQKWPPNLPEISQEATHSCSLSTEQLQQILHRSKWRIN